jgi:hypothetical protein
LSVLVASDAPGHFDQAEPGYRHALSAIETNLGADHPETATVHRLLAELERARGHYATAESHARTSLAIRQTALGADAPAVAADRAVLAALVARRETVTGDSGGQIHTLAGEQRSNSRDDVLRI